LNWKSVDANNETYDAGDGNTEIAEAQLHVTEISLLQQK